MSSFLSKVELKYQLKKMGIKVEGNYVRKRDIKKIITSGIVDLSNKKIDEDDLFQAGLVFGLIAGPHFPSYLQVVENNDIDGTEAFGGWLSENFHNLKWSEEIVPTSTSKLGGGQELVEFLSDETDPNDERIKSLKSIPQEQWPLPIYGKGKGKYWFGDGNHRRSILKQLGKTSMKAYVVDLNDAFKKWAESMSK